MIMIIINFKNFVIISMDKGPTLLMNMCRTAPSDFCSGLTFDTESVAANTEKRFSSLRLREGY